MHRRFLTAALLSVTVLAAACGGGNTSSTDPARAQLLGALPPEEAQRGVYVVDLDEAGDLSPGSRVGPFLGPVLNEASLLVETTAPPVTLLGGVAEGVETPEHTIRVGDTLIFADPEIAEATAERLRSNSEPVDALSAAATATAPVVWTGPTPSRGATGWTTVELTPDEVTFTATPPDDAEASAEQVSGALESEGPPGSPGKLWNTLLGDAAVTVEGNAVVVTAEPRDLPGPLLRSLLDQQQLTFLPG